MANKDCTKCIHNAVCKTAESCDGCVSGCKHFMEEKKRFLLKENGDLIPLEQEWISVKDRLPTEDDADDNGFVFAYTAENKKIIALWTDVCRFSEFVTHWMPLPEAPKGE